MHAEEMRRDISLHHPLQMKPAVIGWLPFITLYALSCNRSALTASVCWSLTVSAHSCVIEFLACKVKEGVGGGLTYM